ncbi:uncharacterized protein [Dermacentor albipictus]|uniref:uncharacterized protein n=1 Tax=Dermacentor albipictus TaxID=60249 RepID=UPI0038FC1631
MRTLDNPFCFLAVQIPVLLGTWLSAPARGYADTAATSPCSVATNWTKDLNALANVILRPTTPCGPGTSTASTELIKACGPNDFFSGQERATTMRTLDNPFCFLAVQIPVLLGTWLSAPARGYADTAATSPCSVATNWTKDLNALANVILRPTTPCGPGTSTASTELIKACGPNDFFSGQERATTMRTLDNPFCFLAVQVGDCPSLHAKRTSNICTLLFPCPQVLVSTVCDCIHVVKLLMLAGDIESNPGPTDTNPNADVLAAITALSEKSDARHIELMDTLTQLKANQVELEQKVCDLTNRLAAVESQVLSLDSERVPALNDAISEAVRAESGAINSRLDDLEDRSRRDNLIFFGIPDTSSETWAESEEHVRKILSEKLDLSFPDESIHRAHRLGSYVSEKCRPIIVKFGSPKLRDKIISQRTKFKNSKVSFSEDFSRATRQSRKKLADFGKASGEKYLLRLNRLFIKKKCYVYCSSTDRVCEVDIAENRSSENRGTSVSASTNTVGSTSFAASSSSL